MEAVHRDDDCRNSLQPDSRARIINKIVDTLRRHLAAPGDEGAQELRAIVSRIENKVYNAATRQSDYLWRISLKMLTMESRAPGSSAPGHSFNAPHYDEY